MSWEVSPKAKCAVNELSPRKYPRSPITSPRKLPQNSLPPPKTPPQWKKPDDVMKSHRLRIKRNALAARMKTNNLFNRIDNHNNSLEKPGTKRHNPFKSAASEECEVPSKKVKEVLAESENDATLFRLLGLNNSQQSTNVLLQFTSILEDQPQVTNKEFDASKLLSTLPIDWTLRHKMRFISSTPLPWNKTLKTCEEASGVTGFVRCVENERNNCNGLDTSPNVEFHQCCFYWQHPNLPWLQLYPRTHLRRTETNKLPFITCYPAIKESLHRDWSESFRSLFQLVRARHCPYFYLVTNSFNCLFRAAGINGCSETNAFISPTTRGFRKLLTDEGVEFTMPLRIKQKRSSHDPSENDTEELVDDESEDVEAGEAKDWLASLGVGADEIKKISDTEASIEFNVEKKMDGNYESLIYVEGSDINAFFNFLINCRTITVTTGPLAGVPPTLLSPVAFHGGTLKSLKVRDSTVKLENENYFSLEINGPILPHAIHNLCNVLKSNVDKFSITFASIESSKAFSLASKQSFGENQNSELDVNKTPGKTFNIENLSDCGLKTQLLSSFCSLGVQNFDSVKYAENAYVCS
ncbi:hypothetical protein O3M35_011913 [Rhynocoris fuscipes]|uniref:Protein downstream neighbor of son homolog n=1 Tax=Rhynocoris fuscipes TaxID=488301 RepID=A0AAW1CXD5_9HEMI